MIHRALQFFSSLRLTVTLLFLAMLLVLFGTLAQVEHGLYQTQSRYFQSFLVYWTPRGTDWKLPVLPGGYLIGAVLLLNLVAMQGRRLKFVGHKISLGIVHAGIAVLIVGQLFSDYLQVESHMQLREGVPVNYSEDSRDSELVIIDRGQAETDRVVSFSESLLVRGQQLRHDTLPFTILVKKHFPNARLSERQPADKNEPPATQGHGRALTLSTAPTATKLDERNAPSGLIEIQNGRESLGTWLVSVLLAESQSVTVGGRTFDIALRWKRYYKPFSLQLQKFTHEVYPGTRIPKHFASRVRLERPDTGEAREAVISMNNPLRYGGETFYQSGFDEHEPAVSVLQAVRNPGWVTPYVACGLITFGLLGHFLSHLITFATKRRAL